MSEVKRIGIPKSITDGIEKIMRDLGYRTLTSFVVEGVRIHYEKKYWEWERNKAEEEERIVEKHEKGERSIEHAFDK